MKFTEKNVLKVMARELDIDKDELEIDDSHLNSFGEGNLYVVGISGGSKEWIVAPNFDVAEAVATAVVKQDLESEPEIFDKSFLESHINIDRLRRDLQSDVESSNYDYYDEMRDDDLVEDAQRAGLEDEFLEEEDEYGDTEIKDRSGLVEALAESKTTEELEDPVAYLTDIYGDQEGIEKAIEVGGIDVDAAADDAVSTDGWEHFLSRYDGNSHETDEGFVYWREN